MSKPRPSKDGFFSFLATIFLLLGDRPDYSQGIQNNCQSQYSRPVRKRLKRFVEEKKGKSASQSDIKQSFELKKLKYYVTVEEVDTYSSLSVELVKADVGNNTLKYFLLITRKLKSYDEQLGPYDALRLIVSEVGSYKLLSHGRALEESVVTPPFNASCILQTLSQLEPDEPWVVCPGIRGYSAYRESICFDIKRVVTGNWYNFVQATVHNQVFNLY